MQNQQESQQPQQQLPQPQNMSNQKQPLTAEELEQLKEKLKPDEKIEANPYLRALEKQEFDQRQKKVYGDSRLYVEKDW